MTVSILGVGESDAVGLVPNKTALELYVESIMNAIRDASVSLTEIDAIVSFDSRTDPHPYHAEYLAEYLGIKPRFALTPQTGGGATISAVAQAAALIETGRANMVLIAAADNMRTGLTRQGGIGSMAAYIGHREYEDPYHPTIPAMVALLAQRHMYEYGTTREDLAAVVVAMRKHGSLNPRAQLQEPVEIEDVLRSEMIADPLTRMDCAISTDGGAAIVLGRSSDNMNRAVEVLGAGGGHRAWHISQFDSLTETGAVESGTRAFAEAAIKPQDVDVAFFYDAFSILPIMFVEDLGFCQKGEGGAFVSDGNLGFSGALPTNPHGGLLSFGHPGRSGAMFMLTEAVRQLRDETDRRRQVPDAQVAMVHAEGGIASTHGTLLLGRS